MAFLIELAISGEGNLKNLINLQILWISRYFT